MLLLLLLQLPLIILLFLLLSLLNLLFLFALLLLLASLWGSRQAAARLEPVAVSELLEDVVAVPVGEAEIQDDDVRLCDLERRAQRAAVGHCTRTVAVALEVFGQQAPDLGVVIDDQHAIRRHGDAKQ